MGMLTDCLGMSPLKIRILVMMVVILGCVFSFIMPVFAGEGISCKMTSSTIEITSKNLSVFISRNNGSINSVKYKGSEVSSGNTQGLLWRVDGVSLMMNTAFRENRTRQGIVYDWDDDANILTVKYDDPGRATVTVKFYFYPDKDYFDQSISIDNHSIQFIKEINFPAKMEFALGGLKRVFFPHFQGVALFPSYFREIGAIGALEHESKYPSMFVTMDYVGFESDYGVAALYAMNSNEFINPSNLTLRYLSSSDAVIYEHAFAVGIKSGETWSSPRVRFAIDDSVLNTLDRYKVDNELDKSPTLREKLGDELFEKFANAPMLKFDVYGGAMGYVETADFLETVPAPSIVHLSSYMPGGHDQSYPDYFPPNPDGGSPEDFRELIDKALELGHLVVPYTNSTWWTSNTTIVKERAADIAVRTEEGRLMTETYGTHGYTISPYSSVARERLEQTIREFTEDYPAHALFDDQIGARPWVWDFHPETPTPISYPQGQLERAKWYLQEKGMPVITEGGWDRLAIDLVGFSGASEVVSVLTPENTAYNYIEGAEYDLSVYKDWGYNRVQVFPMLPYLVHEHVLLYGQDLGSTTTSKRTLGWWLAMGHSMINQIVKYSQQFWQVEQRWIWDVNIPIQRAVVSRYTGKKMTGFEYMTDTVTETRFEDMSIVVSHGKDRYRLDDSVIAPWGFYARTDDGTLIAGVFEELDGFKLAGEAFLIIEKEGDNRIVVQRLRHPYLSKRRGEMELQLPLPSDWDNTLITVVAVTEEFETVVDHELVEGKISFVSKTFIDGARVLKYVITVQ